MSHQSIKDFASSLRGSGGQRRGEDRPFITSIRSPSLLTKSREGRGRSEERTVSSEASPNRNSRSLTHSLSPIRSILVKVSSPPISPPPPLTPLLNLMAPNLVDSKSKFSNFSHGVVNLNHNINRPDGSRHVTFNEERQSPSPLLPPSTSPPQISSFKKNSSNSTYLLSSPEIESYNYNFSDSPIFFSQNNSQNRISPNHITKNKLLLDDMNNSPYIFNIIAESSISVCDHDQETERDEGEEEDDESIVPQENTVDYYSLNNLSFPVSSSVNSSLTLSPPQSSISSSKSQFHLVTTPSSSPMIQRKSLESPQHQESPHNFDPDSQLRSKNMNNLASSTSLSSSTNSISCSTSSINHSSSTKVLSSLSTRNHSKNRSLNEIHQIFHRKKMVEQQEQYKKQKELRQEIRSLTFSQLQTELETYSNIKNMNALERIKLNKEIQENNISIMTQNLNMKTSKIKSFHQKLEMDQIKNEEDINQNLNNALYSAEIRRLVQLDPDFEHQIPDSPIKEETIQRIKDKSPSSLIHSFSNNINKLKEQFKTLQDQQAQLEDSKQHWQQQIQRDSWNQLKKHDQSRMFSSISSKRTACSSLKPSNLSDTGIGASNEIINSQSLEQQVEFCEQINLKGRLRTESFNQQLKNRIHSRKF